MAIEMLDGESSEYRSARKDLLAAEMDLRQRRKDVAALRRCRRSRYDGLWLFGRPGGSY